MRSEDLYLNDIVAAIDLASEFTRGMTYSQFLSDRKTQAATIWQLQVIGEAARNVSATLKAANPDVPWSRMAGMRNRLAHKYFGIDYQIVWTVLERELPDVREKLKNLLGRTQGQSRNS